MSTDLGTNLLGPLSSHTSVILTNNSRLAILATCDTVAETQVGVYEKGCLLIRTDTGGTYVNTGTSASPTWTLNSTSAITGPTGITGVTGPTGPTGPQGTAA